jgi:hypothetical protein
LKRIFVRVEEKAAERVANLMGELLETNEVSHDKTTAKELKRALQEVEDGKIRPIED